MNKLKYKGYAIVFQEIPNEITLALNICGCPHKCEGCHSQYLWDNDGIVVEEDLEKLLDKYKNYITCVCFMGGDQEINNLFELKKIVSKYNLKTAIYSGSDDIKILNALKDMNFDYIKIGSYKKELGGLDKETTNQRMFKFDKVYVDITKTFQTKKI